MAVVYDPVEILPIYRSTATVTIKKKVYKNYFETDTKSVVTEDGVTLAELLDSVGITGSSNVYTYKGTLINLPDQTAMEQLYAMTDQKTGDVYLIQCVGYDSTIYYETYSWGTATTGWVFCGTTSKSSSMDGVYSNIVKLFPDDLGEPCQVLVTNEKGDAITWGPSPQDLINKHDVSETAHADLRKLITANTIAIFNDVIGVDGWTYNDAFPCFEYVYSPEKGTIYFDISPVYLSSAEASAIAGYGLYNSYQMVTPSDGNTYAIIRSKRIPTAPITICVKSFENGTVEEEAENTSSN